jgi:PAS domain S-box-containing protein
VVNMKPSDEVLSGLLAAAPDALVAVDPGGTIVFANDQAEHLFGWSRDDLVGQPVELLVPQRFSPGHPSLRAGYMGQPSTRPMGAGLELWACRKDGTEFPAEISLSSFTASEGTLVAAAIRDVTVSRRTEQRFRAVLASGPDAIVGVSELGHIELVNAQVERLFGWSPDELIGLAIETLVPEAAHDIHVLHRERFLGDPLSSSMSTQVSARRKDGSTFPAEISLSAVTDEPGERMVLAAVRDATDRIEVEAVRERHALVERREQTQRLESLGQLAGGVAHDFNNLLGVILNYTTLVSRRLTDPTARSHLDEIQAAAERAAGLTKQLLTFARRDMANPEPLDVNQVIHALAGMLDRTLGEEIELRLELPDEPLVVLADQHQLDQIVLNLAFNARDAMPDGGVLTITGEPSGADVIVQVVDTGKGMSSEVAGRAFEPFFTTKPTGEGTGLGLATVYGIVQQGGGHVAIESSVGHGTTVSVRLPGAGGAQPAIRARLEASEGGGERILLVEDEPALRAGTAEILLERGYDVLVASDGVDALEVLECEPGKIDVVVTDVVMPRMRGDELARILVANDPDLPVIFMSGYASGPSSVSGRLLQKPVAEHVLLRALREVLDG